jgi:hypothetical protein
MTAGPQPAGFLTHQSWRADHVLASKIARGRPACAAPSAARAARPRAARARAAEVLAARLHGEDLTDVVVLVSELVTNAVRHGRAGGTCVWFERELAPA